MKNYEINGYKLISQIGKGKMAEVWYAENSLGKPASIKIMHPKFIGEAAIIARFEAEAKAINKLNHPNIRNVIDFGIYENRPFIVLEYLEGQDLSSYLKNNPKIANNVIASWWNTCIEALQYTHSQHIIHRDLKPSNLFLTQNGVIKIVDFGIAKLRDDFMITTTGQGIGTLAYMSPEQIKNSKEVTCTTDYYSLGITFLKILSNKLPFADTSSEFELMKQIVEGVIDMKGISEEWTYIIKNATLSIPDHRKLIPYGDEQKNQLDFNQNKKTTNIQTSKEEPLEDTQIDLKNTINTHPKKTENNKFAFVFSLIFIILTFSIVIWEWKLKENKYDTSSLTFSEGFASVKKDDKWGYINKEGKEVLPFIYDAAGDFKEGLALVGKDGKWGLINKKGKELTLFIYDYEFEFSEGLACVSKNGKYGFLNKAGKEVIPCIYEISFVSGFNFKEGLVGLSKEGKWGYLNKEGKELIPFIYDDAKSFSEGLVAVKKEGKWGYLNKEGKQVIPFIYDAACSFSEGLASVKKNHKFGYINKAGKELISFMYDDGMSFSEGLASVKKNGKYGYVSKNGNDVIPFIYDGAMYFKEGLASIEKDGKWGCVNKEGREVVSCIYHEIWYFTEGIAEVKMHGKYGCINKAGKEVIPLIYDELTVRKGLVYVSKDGNHFWINKKGECVKDCP